MYNRKKGLVSIQNYIISKNSCWEKQNYLEQKDWAENIEGGIIEW
jgi:hypothetical protein